MEKRPSEFHAGLTEQRIQAVAQVILNARTACLEHHDEISGDTNWSYGCRARDWTRQALRTAAEDGQYDFLSIIEDNGQKFVIGIAGIPVKFFKDDAEEPAARVFKRSASELDQLLLFKFDGIDTPEDVAWRLCIDINPIDLEVLKIIFVGLDRDGDAICYYTVPLQQAVAKVYDIAASHEEGVELSAPKVVKKQKDNNTAKEAANGK